MSMLQQQAKALGDPTRHRMFRLVAESDTPLTVADLVEQVGHSHNAIRQHLAKLLAADLLVETVAEPEGRGRPHLLYQVAPSADSRWGVVGPYERLATLLAEVLRTGDDAVEVGRRAGRALAPKAERSDRGQHPSSNPQPVRTFVEEMVRQGFDPQAIEADAGAHIALRACPFESAALTDPATVCGLHQGMIEGLAESVGGLVVDELVIRHADDHECHLHCHVE